MHPKQKQIEEWLESEVTRYFLSLIQKKLDYTFKQRGEVFFPFEPMKTQEVKAGLLGAEGELQDVIDAFESKNLSQLYEEEHEQVGNPSSVRSSADQAG